MRIRIKFAKKENVRFLGHLDIMRFFQRCFNRAGIRMEYSIGYNPHQKMSFAQPLGVGIISVGEYLDAEIADGQDPEEICRRLNDVCGDGFEVINVRAVEEGAKKAMAALRYASYEINIHGLLAEYAPSGNNDCVNQSGIMAVSDAAMSEHSARSPENAQSEKHDDCVNQSGIMAVSQETIHEHSASLSNNSNSVCNPYTTIREAEVRDAVDKLLAMDEIPVIKKTKSGEKETDIRPQIIRVELKDDLICATVTSGSDNNLKPDTLLQAIFSKTNVEYQREMVTIKRTDLYADDFIALDGFQTL